MERRDLLDLFFQEGGERIAEFEAALLGLERNAGDTDLLNLVFRSAHVLLSLRRSLATQRRAMRLEAVPATIAERWQRAGLLELVDPAPAHG